MLCPNCEEPIAPEDEPTEEGEEIECDSCGLFFVLADGSLVESDENDFDDEDDDILLLDDPEDDEDEEDEPDAA